MNNLVFTGSESSGKTTLAKKITELKDGFFVAEYAREYLKGLSSEYEQNDLLKIATATFNLQQRAKKNHKHNLFFDTDLLTIKIWSEYKYGYCDQWILDRILSNKEFTYVLCSPDIKWEFDPLRESPNDRDELHEIYLENLIKFNLNFVVVGGELPERIKFLLKKY